MKITRISTYQVSLPRDRVYRLSGGRTVSAFESTHVLMETDSGLTGVGEVCPFGSIYLPAYPAGTHTGIAEIAPHLLGADPTQLEVINQRMDMALKGHPYAKSALDMACWDLLGPAGPGDGALRLRPVGRSVRRQRRPLSPHPPRCPRHHGGIGGRRPGRGFSPLPTQDRWRAGRRYRPRPRHGRGLGARRPGGLRRQRRLAGPRGGPGGAGRRRPRHHDRAALRHLRSLPHRAPAHRPALHPRRSHRLGTNAAAGPRRRRHGRGQHQDRQAGRPDPGRGRCATWACRSAC